MSPSSYIHAVKFPLSEPARAALGALGRGESNFVRLAIDQAKETIELAQAARIEVPPPSHTHTSSARAGIPRGRIAFGRRRTTGRRFAAAAVALAFRLRPACRPARTWFSGRTPRSIG